MIKNITTIIFFLSIIACNAQNKNNTASNMEDKHIFKYQLTEEEWKKKLTPEQYYVLRQQGTERPHTGKYNLHKEKGIYVCAGCGAELFSSDMKFESYCGWPSFDKELPGGKILKRLDKSFGMIRTEIICANCGGHLGHLFDDGPTETGLRYCVNSLSLDFIKKED